MSDAEGIRDQVNEVMRWLDREIGETTPIDHMRGELLTRHAEWLHKLRHAEPSVETESGGIKSNPDHAAALQHAAHCRHLLKELEGPVLAKRAAAAAAKQQPVDHHAAARAAQQEALERTPPS